MKLTLVGTGITLPHVDAPARRYNLANAYLDAYVRSAPQLAGQVETTRIDLPLSLDQPGFQDDALGEVIATAPDVLGLSCYAWDIEAQLSLAAKAKVRLPSLRIVLGGPSASFRARDILLEHPAVDAVVRGEGEITLAELLLAGEPQGIAGVTWRDGHGQVHEEPDRALVEDLGALPSPLLSGVLEPPRQNLMLEFSRGCIYRCTYCAWKLQGGGVRRVPEARMAGEIGWARERGYEHAFLIDSAINNETEHLEAVARSFRTEDPKQQLALSYFVNHERLCPSQVRSLGCIRPHEITVGLESVNPAALRAAGRKPLDPSQFERSLHQLSEVAPASLSIMLGMPGDDLRGFRATLDYAAAIAEKPGRPRVRMVRVHWMIIAPGSRLAQRADRHGLVIADKGIPYVLGSRTFPREHLLEALHVLHSHPRADLFVWEDAEPLRLLGADAPELGSPGGDHLGGRTPGKIDEHTVLQVIRPLVPGRALPGGWRVGPLGVQQGHPVVVLQGPDARMVRVQLRPRGAEPRPFARTTHFDLIWLEPSPTVHHDAIAEQRLVQALARLVRKNEPAL